MNPKVAEALNQVALPVVPYATCKRADYWWFQVKPSMICCGYTLPDELQSVCQVRQTHKHFQHFRYHRLPNAATCFLLPNMCSAQGCCFFG